MTNDVQVVLIVNLGTQGRASHGHRGGEEHEPGIRRLGTSIISDQDPGFTDDRDSGSRRAILAVAVHHIVQVQCANTALSRVEQG
jgi:hypothetical protein